MSNTCLIIKALAVLWTIFQSISASAQNPVSEKLDSTISIFWNPDIKVHIRILDPEEPNPDKNNAVLTLYTEDRGNQKIFFRDSLYAYLLKFSLKDMNGDGISDLLVYNYNNGVNNQTYNLYLVDQKKGRLIPVNKFEKIYNPFYDQKHCLIMGVREFGNSKLIMSSFIIDKNGMLKFVLGDF